MGGLRMGNEYEVTRTGTNTWRVEKREPVGCGSYIGVAIMVVIMLFVLRSCSKGTPNVDGNYKTNKKQTAYVLQNG